MPSDRLEEQGERSEGQGEPERRTGGPSMPGPLPLEPEVERKALELADALARSETYRRLERARQEVAEHEAAKLMLRDLEQRERRLREKQSRGEAITEAEIEELQRVSEVVSFNPYVRDLLQAEYAFAMMWLSVEQTLAEAVGMQVPGAGAVVAAGPGAAETPGARAAAGAAGGGATSGAGGPAGTGAPTGAGGPGSEGTTGSQGTARPASGRIARARSKLWVPGQPLR